MEICNLREVIKERKGEKEAEKEVYRWKLPPKKGANFFISAHIFLQQSLLFPFSSLPVAVLTVKKLTDLFYSHSIIQRE